LLLLLSSSFVEGVFGVSFFYCTRDGGIILEDPNSEGHGMACAEDAAAATAVVAALVAVATVFFLSWSNCTFGGEGGNTSHKNCCLINNRQGSSLGTCLPLSPLAMAKSSVKIL
jgi:hypothetical protein